MFRKVPVRSSFRCERDPLAAESGREPHEIGRDVEPTASPASGISRLCSAVGTRGAALVSLQPPASCRAAGGPP